MAATPPTVPSVPPDPPDRSDRVNFNLKAYNWANYQKVGLYADLQAIPANVYANATLAYNSAVSAQGYATSALALTNFKGPWASQVGSMLKGSSVAHIGSYWGLLNDAADVTVIVPGTSAQWQLINPDGRVTARRTSWFFN